MVTCTCSSFVDVTVASSPGRLGEGRKNGLVYTECACVNIFRILFAYYFVNSTHHVFVIIFGGYFRDHMIAVGENGFADSSTVSRGS